jgi:hypothetical protein
MLEMLVIQSPPNLPLLGGGNKKPHGLYNPLLGFAPSVTRTRRRKAHQFDGM